MIRWSRPSAVSHAATRRPGAARGPEKRMRDAWRVDGIRPVRPKEAAMYHPTLHLEQPSGTLVTDRSPPVTGRQPPGRP
jgi:hypothetical protein